MAFYVFFLKFSVVFVFVIIVLVQFCIILVRNNMFYYKKTNHQIWLKILTMYEKKLIKFWPILVMLYVKSRFFFCIARGVQLDNGVHPLGTLNSTNIESLWMGLRIVSIWKSRWQVIRGLSEDSYSFSIVNT